MSQEPIETPGQARSRMGFDEREMMMCYLLRVPGVFLEARTILTPDHFTEPYEIIWATAWRCCMDLYDQFGAMPAYLILEADALGRLEARPEEVPPEACDELRNFLAYIFDTDLTAFTGAYESYGFEILQKFLKERHWTDPMRNYLHDIGNEVPINLPELLRDYSNRLVSIDGIRNNVMETLIPDGWESSTVTRYRTGISFIDDPMGGGWVSGEIYGLLGPFGGGKTMLAGQIACEMAVRFFTEAVAAHRPPRHVFFFTYEMPVDEIRRRMISHLSGVNLNHLTAGPWSATLSRQGRRHSYEELMYSEDPRGEYERVEAIRPIGNIIHIVNMRGDRSAPKAGSGWVDEIHAELEKWRRLHGGNLEVGQVFIDYALICTRRYIKARGWDEDRKLRHLVGSFGDECRRLVSDHFGCSTWILNQMSAEANKKASSAVQHYADSSEARNFAENMHYVFLLGTKDRENNCVQFVCGKTRRSEGSPRPSVLFLRGEMARFEAADSRFMVDPARHRIVSRRVGNTIVGDVPRDTPVADPSATHVAASAVDGAFQ